MNILPNHPCPCGSGKRYKKCCGLKGKKKTKTFKKSQITAKEKHFYRLLALFNDDEVNRFHLSLDTDKLNAENLALTTHLKSSKKILPQNIISRLSEENGRFFLFLLLKKNVDLIIDNLEQLPAQTIWNQTRELDNLPHYLKIEKIKGQIPQEQFLYLQPLEHLPEYPLFNEFFYQSFFNNLTTTLEKIFNILNQIPINILQKFPYIFIVYLLLLRNNRNIELHSALLEQFFSMKHPAEFWSHDAPFFLLEILYSPPPTQQKIKEIISQILDDKSAPSEIAIFQALLYSHLNTFQFDTTFFKLCQKAFSSHQWFQKNSFDDWCSYALFLLSHFISNLSTIKIPPNIDFLLPLLTKAPWPSCQFNPDEFDVLNSIFLHFNLLKRQRTFLIQFQQQIKKRGELKTWKGKLEYWFGVSFFQENPSHEKKVRQHWFKALQEPTLSDQQRCSILFSLFKEIDFEELEYQFRLIKDPQFLPYQQLKIMYYFSRQDEDKAFEEIQKGLKLYPDDNFLRTSYVYALFQKKQLPKAEDFLLPMLTEDNIELVFFATLALTALYLEEEKPQEALEVIEQFKKRKEGEELSSKWMDTFYYNEGIAHEHLEDFEKAAEAYKNALIYQESQSLYERLLSSLFIQEKFDEVAKYAEQALKKYPDYIPFKYSLLPKEEIDQNWSKILTILEEIGDEWPRENDILKDTILLKMYALFSDRGAFEALAYAEKHLDFIVTEEELKQLHQQLFKELQKEIQLLQRGKKNREKKLEAFEETKKLWQKQRKKIERNQRNLLKKLKEEIQQFSFLQQTMTHEYVQERLEKEFEDFLEQHHLEKLGEETKQLLKSAELLWRQWKQKTDEDHGPVILQLARAVESEANKRIVDVLVNFALKNGYQLEDLPLPRTTQLKESQNRLSLGEIASLLYYERVKEEADGSRSWSINPRSPKRHKELLNIFWAEIKNFQKEEELLQEWKQGLPFDLQALAQLRNKAGHAGQPLSRTQAQKARQLVYGMNDQRGILAKLLLFQS